MASVSNLDGWGVLVQALLYFVLFIGLVGVVSQLFKPCEKDIQGMVGVVSLEKIPFDVS